MSLKKIVRVPHESQLSGTAKTNSEKKTLNKKKEKGYTLTRALWDTWKEKNTSYSGKQDV